MLTTSFEEEKRLYFVNSDSETQLWKEGIKKPESNAPARAISKSYDSVVHGIKSHVILHHLLA